MPSQQSQGMSGLGLFAGMDLGNTSQNSGTVDTIGKTAAGDANASKTDISMIQTGNGDTSKN